VDVAVIGSGSIGLATAYYLAQHHGIANVALIDAYGPTPMASIPAQLAGNYRNGGPHPTMVTSTSSKAT
jgi:glycine/D-amino acid oxidase-like deaminating enzyme